MGDIGGKAGLARREEAVGLPPRTGRNAFPGSGAKLFGPTLVGDDCVVSAIAVVNQNVPESGISIAGVSAKVVSDSESEAMITDPDFFDVQNVVEGRS